MNGAELEGLTKPALVELVLRMQRPDKTSRTSSKPPSRTARQNGSALGPAEARPATRDMRAVWPIRRTLFKITARRTASIAVWRLPKMRQVR